jgi:hypothetical protein
VIAALAAVALGAGLALGCSSSVPPPPPPAAKPAEVPAAPPAAEPPVPTAEAKAAELAPPAAVSPKKEPPEAPPANKKEQAKGDKPPKGAVDTIQLSTGGKAKAVAFTHKAHVGYAANDCKKCHHTGQNAGCKSCHDATGAKGGGKTTKDAFHKQCIDCHKTGGKGPTACMGCHAN